MCKPQHFVARFDVEVVVHRNSYIPPELRSLNTTVCEECDSNMHSCNTEVLFLHSADFKFVSNTPLLLLMSFD